MQRKYRCIVKVNRNGVESFLKYRTTNLVKFTNYLDSHHPDWKWYNVYDKQTGDQVGNYTINYRPKFRHIE